jgi:hypothetical protein
MLGLKFETETSWVEIAKQVIKATMLYIDLEKSIPEFTLDKESYL